MNNPHANIHARSSTTVRAKLSLCVAGIFLAAVGTGFGQRVITTDPQSRTNIVGTDASFTVVATGAEPLDYQWRFGPSNLPLSGKTNAALVLTNVQTANARNLPTQNVREINNQKGKQT